MLRGTRLKGSKPVAFASIDYCTVDDDASPVPAHPDSASANPVKMAELESLRRQKGISNLALSSDGTKLLVGVTNGTWV